MSLTFITLKDRNGRRSSLGISDKSPDVLRVIGALPHGTEVKPATKKDAQRLADWLCKVYSPSHLSTRGM